MSRGSAPPGTLGDEGVPVRYQIQLRGKLRTEVDFGRGAVLAGRRGGFELVVQADDPAALTTVLERIDDAGLQVVALIAVPEADGAQAPADGVSGA